MKIKKILKDAVTAVCGVFGFIAECIDPCDNLVKVTMPYTRQSFAENVKNSGKQHKNGERSRQ